MIVRGLMNLKILNVRTLTWAVVAAWFLVCLVTLDYNGPFMDEGIYVTAGQRALEGHGLDDGYLGWFAGSLLWPMLAGLGHRVGGLLGARAVALALATLAFCALILASRNLYGEQAAFWTALAFAASGPFMTLARMAVYDASALAGIAVSLYAITELARSDHRKWAVGAALAFCWAVFSKYPTALMLLPLVGVWAALRGRKTAVDLGLFGFVGLAVGLAFFLPLREQVAAFIAYRLVHSPATGVSRAMIAVDLARLSAAPLLLAAGGWWAARRRLGLATVLLSAMWLWPAYHLALGDPVSSNKHLVLGFLFGYPLAGLALERSWAGLGARVLEGRGRAQWAGRAIAAAWVLALVALGAAQARRLSVAWPDARPTAAYLVDQVQPGHKLLINESWPYTMYLYGEGRVRTPWDVYDVYRIEHGQSEIDLCAYDWFVDSRGAYRWPASIAFDVHRCGVFEPVWTAESTVVSMGTDLNYVRYPVQVVVWKNVESVGVEP
jgi:4-amino-4-deoxy-L-arabinose transferase-like glycosyltransferase